MMRDPDFGIVRVRAYGTFDFKVVDVKTFLKEVAGTDHHFRLDEFADTMRSRIVSVFTDALASAKVPVLDVASRYSRTRRCAAARSINPGAHQQVWPRDVAVSLSRTSPCRPKSTGAIDKRSSMAAIGNLNDYVKFQMAEAMGKGGDGGGMANTAAQLGAGLAMGQQMMAAMGAPQTTPAAATLEAGDLKGKKIGSTWRVTKAALDEFLKT
jgi:membrane protease subunit (stomatin/prohibitin family)